MNRRAYLLLFLVWLAIIMRNALNPELVVTPQPLALLILIFVGLGYIVSENK